MRLPRVQFNIRGLMIAVAVLAIVIGGLVLAFRPEYTRLTLLNRSGQSISRLVITFSGEQSVIADLADGATATVPFRVHDDEAMRVAAVLGNGKAIRAGFKIGNPKRYSRIACDILEDGGVQLTLDPSRR